MKWSYQNPQQPKPKKPKASSTMDEQHRNTTVWVIGLLCLGVGGAWERDMGHGLVLVGTAIFITTMIKLFFSERRKVLPVDLERLEREIT